MKTIESIIMYFSIYKCQQNMGTLTLYQTFNCFNFIRKYKLFKSLIYF